MSPPVVLWQHTNDTCSLAPAPVQRRIKTINSNIAGHHEQEPEPTCFFKFYKGVGFLEKSVRVAVRIRQLLVVTDVSGFPACVTTLPWTGDDVRQCFSELNLEF
jgi:hypothetical protein